MKSDTFLDYAVFHLSPKHSRCDLLVSGNGDIEKIGSGLLNPFVTHLRFTEEQNARALQSIKLEVDKCKTNRSFFTKGTLERFVRFVSTPEVLELVNTFDVEMSQLEAAQRIYSQGLEDQLSSSSGGVETGVAATADITKKELLRAIDVRLLAVGQDLATACARASAAGFTPETVPDLQLFADQFGAHRLNEACRKFISFSQRRPHLINQWKAGIGSDMSSIDDDLTRPQHHLLISSKGPHQEQDETQHLVQSNCSTCHQPPNPSSISFPLGRSVRESSTEWVVGRESDVTVEQEHEKEETVTESRSTSQLTRRLSVQDRINLFENKQKEQSVGGGKPVFRKSVELRRLSSDLGSASASADKAVFRRWSGANDMNLSASISQTQQSGTFPSVSKDKEEVKGLKADFSDLLHRVEDSGLKDSADSHTQIGDSSHREEVFVSKDTTDSEIHSEDIGFENQLVFPRAQLRNPSGRAEHAGLKDKSSLEIQSRYSSAGVEDISSKNLASSQSQFSSFADGAKQVELKNQSFRDFQGGEELTGVKYEVASLKQFRASSDQDHRTFKTQFGAPSSRVENVGMRKQPATQALSKASPNTTLDIGFSSKDPLGSQIHSKAFSGKVEANTGTKGRATSQSHSKGFESDLLVPQSHWRSFPGEPEEVGEKDGVSSQRQFGDFSSEMEESGFQGMKSQRQITAPIEQVQKLRQSRGNQELNDELQLKANELEKLFAEHKLRVPGDQSASSRRSKPVDVHVDQIASSVYRKPTQVTPVQFPENNSVREPFENYVNVAEFDFNSLLKIVDTRDYGNSLKQNIMELSSLENSRGKLYDMYMQKRDAKLREEWGSKRAQNEAKMKAIHESLERSRAELKAKFAGSTDRQDPTLHARRRAEKFRSFHIRSASKNIEQPIEPFQSGDDEDLSELQEHSQYEQGRSFSETFLGDGSSRSSQSKKLIPNGSFSSSIPRISATPIPRSSIKASISGSGRRRTQPENPLVQSLPYFSEFRKENAKPSGNSKTTTRMQFRNYARSNSKSTSEELALVKEENPRLSQSMRKSSASPGELKDLSPLNSDGVVSTPLRFGKEQTVQSPYNKIPKNNESKPFLRKGNGIGPGAGVGIAKLKASLASETLKTEESDDLSDQPVDFVDICKEEVGKIETVMDEEVFKAVNYPAQADNEKSRSSQESEKSGNPGSENSEILISLSPVESDFATEAAAVPSTFHSAEEHVQDSLCESPASWNSRVHNTFSYVRETSDIDASVDSQMGSPASRMRKKWGNAQKPFLVSNASQQQYRKDVTKGFKRLLKFGRKSRGTEGLVDWISATTSEGDDDTEDGRDLANRSSEDMRKSRMGFLQGHPSYDVLNDAELFNEQVQALRSSIPAPPLNFKLREDHLSGTGSSLKAPRSFFSLSSFRSKGNESKPR